MRAVYGPLDVVGFEQLASDPATLLFEGRVYYNTTSDTLRLYKNGAWKEITDEDATGLTSDGLTFPRTSTANKTVTTGNVLLFPEGIIDAAHTYTVNSGGYLHATGSLTITGTLNSPGTTRIIT